MRAQLFISALLLTSCTTSVEVRGRYAAALSGADIAQIRRVTQDSRHPGDTRITVDAVQRDRVYVKSCTQRGAGTDITTLYVIRRDGRWQIDQHSPITAEGERTVTVY
jgi:hypothetical protein